jgi:hypothetical protein
MMQERGGVYRAQGVVGVWTDAHLTNNKAKIKVLKDF